MIGIEFTYNNGVRDWYDPVNLDKDWYESADEYIVQVGANTYRIQKKYVKSIRHYDLCNNCGWEIKDSECSHCAVKAEKEG